MINHKIEFYGKKWLLLFFMIFYVLAHAAFANNENYSEQKTELTNITEQEALYKKLEQILISKLEFYASEFRDIDFIILDSTADIGRNMQALGQIIGENPDALDYEHPEDLRETLLLVTLGRIEYLMEMDAGSSTLFRPGTNAMAQRKYACVITIDPLGIAANGQVATRHLLDLTDEEFNKIAQKKYLDHVSHLNFTFDHEVYHCLDTRFNGPIPMSQHEYWSGYQSRKNELGADAFGIIMNLAANRKVTDYAKRIKNIRGLALLNNDIDHYTYDSIATALELDPVKLSESSVTERFKIASKIRRQYFGTYDEYVRYMQAAEFAAQHLSMQSEENELINEELDTRQVWKIVKDTRESYQSLVGEEIPFGR